MKTFFPFLFLLLPFFSNAQGGVATPGPGDTCTTAITAVLNGLNSIDSIYYPSVPLEQSDATEAKWFVYTPESAGVYTVYSCLQGEDTRVAIYKGTCDALTLVTFNDDACEMTIGGDAYASQVYWEAEANSTYYIVWDNSWDSSGFNFRLETSDVVLTDVTFSVDMSGQTISETGVLCLIIDQNFAQVAIPMTGSGNVLSGTSTLIAGQSYVYIFLNGQSNDELEVLPDSCSESFQGFNLRLLAVVPEVDAALDTVCFGYCAACPAPTTTVTLTVDMASNESFGNPTSPAGVHVAGDFQSFIGATANWQPNETPLTQVGTTTKWTGTFEIPEGNYELKFINGDAWGSDESVSGLDCESGTSGNRALVVGSEPIDLEVCFRYCVTCNLVSTNDIDFGNGFRLMPNPATEQTTLQINLKEANDLQINIANTLGQVVRSLQIDNISQGNVSLDLNNLSAGLYQVHVNSGMLNAVKSLVIKR